MSISNSHLELELVTSSERWHALEAEWRALLATSDSLGVFLSWEWASTWWEVFRKRSSLWILLARERSSGRVVGIAPFVLRKRPIPHGPFRELSLLGNTAGAADHLDLISLPGFRQSVASSVASFLRQFRNDWDLLRLDGVAADSPLLEELGQRARVVTTWDSPCPYLPLPGRANGSFTRLDAKVSKNLRRIQREALEPVGFHRVTSPAEVSQAMADLFDLHQSVRTARGDRGAFHEEPVRRFHRQLAERFLSRGWLRLYQLRVGADAIAVAYCFRHQSTVSFYQTGYDLRWARYSPGFSVISHAILSSIHEKAAEFDFLRGADSYKLRWTSHVRRDVRLRMANNSRGHLLLLAQKLAPGARQKVGKWRMALSSANDKRIVPA